jgi:cobalt-zinc-cadmium efflux system outer membrane protein
MDVEPVPRFVPTESAAAGQIDAALKPAVSRPEDPASVQRTSGQQSVASKKSEQQLAAPQPQRRRLEVPRELPGAGTPRVTLPPTDAPAEVREAAINKLFPNLTPLGLDPQPGAGPEGRPLTLSDLQHLASSNSPLIRQAASDVEAAKGALVQAGAYPNPTTGFAQDEVGTGGNSPGELGIVFNQTFILGGKLKVARAMAEIDLRNSELALKRARADLAGQVRTNYFATLVAQENLKVSRALARFTDEIYNVQVDQVKVAQAAAYEPRQLRVFAMQARGALVAARNRYVSAWKQLAAVLGLPGMAPTELAGRVDMPVPVYHYDAVLALVLTGHTDVLTAKNSETKARLALEKARVTPVPDVTLSYHYNKDLSTNNYAHSGEVSFPIPIFDRNKGGIVQAQGNLVRAVEETHRVRDDLTTRLADAFERYNTNRLLLEDYRDSILTDQVEAYLGAYERHQQEPDKVGFGDVVAAQQALATTISSYVTTLGNLWTAVADLSTLLQTDNVFQAAQMEQVPPMPDLEHLPELPCYHPCSPASPSQLQAVEANWPPTATGRKPSNDGQEATDRK